MKSFISLIVRRPITILMIIISILILGLISLSRLSIDSMPNMQMPYISIQTRYRNAGPEEIEKSITKIVEGAIATVNNIKNITSYSRENSSDVMVEFNWGVNLREASEDIREALETEFSDAYRVVIASLEEGSIQQEDGLNAEDAVKKILDELEKRAEKIQMKVYLYQYPLLKVSVLEESEKWHRLTKRIGEEMIRRQAWYRWDTNGEKECEVRKYLAESYFKLGENLKAAEQYEQIRKLESNGEELEEIYEKLQLIYEEAQEYEKVWEISREAVEVLPDSERLWMNYLERYCENPEMERELCAEAVKKAIQAVPELAESEAFKQLQGKYKIVIDGENIRVGE